ncbi:hypothetical protein LPJ61_000279 [Coemansia biformis]|uniref:acylaminoacyl-peptidase n=1 Tax=Coemansia biformis TaxID=1286918 RepID=A0A9W8CYA2_9FUNG|nr:hypothetical protein LPJ61_000279 [Coemansia biformis]
MAMYTAGHEPFSSSAGSAGSAGSSASNSRASVEFARFIRETFDEAFGVPSFVAATAKQTTQPGVVHVEYTTSQRDFARDRKRKVASHVALAIRGGEAAVLARGAPADVTGVCMSLPSPTDPSLVAVLRSQNEPAPERFVEVWRDDALVKTIDVTSKHGDFYGDSTFGCLAWSGDAKAIVYAAERPEYDKAKPEPAEPADSGTLLDKGDITDDISGGVAGIADPRLYEFDGDWGETFSGKRPPVLVVLDLGTGSARVLPQIDGVSPGQAQILAGGSGAERVVFTGYAYAGRKHGIVYCENRPSGIYTCDLDGGNVECIYSGSARSPRVMPSRKGVVFLATGTGGPHAAASEIVHYDLATRQASTVVPIVGQPLREPQSVGGTWLPAGFPGVYATQLPAQPWLRVSERPELEILALDSTWRSTTAVLTLDVQNRVLARHTPVDGTECNAVLSAGAGLLVCSLSTPAQPSLLAVGTAAADPQTRAVSVQWARVERPAVDNVAWQVLRGGRAGGDGPLESIFVFPREPGHATRYFWPGGAAAASRPLVVMPHGGPHSTYTLAYNALAAGLARLGFGVLLVNFTGSLGFGQDAVLAQIGKMDTLSLDEIQDSALRVHECGGGDPGATVYLGGSYSGYTGALLAGRAPGFYRGIALRNPVISIGENAAMSDIPDWCWAELGLEYSFEAPPELTPEAFARMWQASPSRLADKVRDPLLLLLGAGDRRVPPAQSLSFYYRLKAAGAPVQCKVYPSVGHPLDTVVAERDSFVSIARFFAAALKRA